MAEKLSIRESAKSLKKYGSTSNHQTARNETIIKHTVSSGDTLQGIALRYGVTTEQIRRANRLWATDSLFLREYLDIPVSVDSPYSPTGNSHTSRTEHMHSQRSLETEQDEEDDNSIKEFLSKIDSSIAVTKDEVLRCQGTSEFLTGLDHGAHEKRKNAVSRMRQQASAVNNNSQQHPQQAVVNQGRKVRTSLQRLEQQQDEMFEL